MRDSSEWVGQLLAQHGTVGGVVPVAPHCCSVLQLRVAVAKCNLETLSPRAQSL